MHTWWCQPHDSGFVILTHTAHATHLTACLVPHAFGD
jgi:hypothetical protein